MYSPSEIEDLVEMKGKVEFQLLREDGSEERWEVDNLVLTLGKNVIANRLGILVPTAAAMTHMALGTGASAVGVGDIGLAAEIARVALTSTTVVGAVITYAAGFPPGTGTGALQEAGIMNAGAGGTELCRVVYAVINKAAGDTLNVSWTVTVG